MELNFNFEEQTMGLLTTLEVDDSLFNSSVLATGMNQGRRTTTAGVLPGQ